MKPSEVLKVNRELMRHAYHRGYFAADSAGQNVEFANPMSCKFCSIGGLQAMRAHGLVAPREVDRASEFLSRSCGTAICTESDRGQEYAIRLHDRAIALAESEGQ